MILDYRCNIIVGLSTCTFDTFLPVNLVQLPVKLVLPPGREPFFTSKNGPQPH